jgi:replication-associated recombination protein RarA
MHFGALKTVPGGYRVDEVRSSLQKSLRRGLEWEALFWGSELDFSGYGAYVMRTLRLIASEDVGLAWPDGPAVIRALQESFLEVRKEEKRRQRQQPDPASSAGMTYLVHGILLLCRAQKSRMVDNACVVFYADREALQFQQQFEISDYSLDHHTQRGRAMGRTEEAVRHESYRLENVALPDPYWQWRKTEGDLSPQRQAQMPAAGEAEPQLGLLDE